VQHRSSFDDLSARHNICVASSSPEMGSLPLLNGGNLRVRLKQRCRWQILHEPDSRHRSRHFVLLRSSRASCIASSCFAINQRSNAADVLAAASRRSMVRHGRGHCFQSYRKDSRHLPRTY
jgi:hypothetical protein